MYVDDESFIDMATSISGSGPAYIFMLMESMIDAGVHMGFPRDKATTLVYHTMLGSTLYAMESKEHPAILRNAVTSPSGTTASALYELEQGRFRTVIKDAMWACYRRSLEMGNNDSNVGPGRYHIPEPRIIVRTTATDSNDLSETIHSNHNKNRITATIDTDASRRQI
jgi:Pyrroline-5-carboxylate reductase dimerisation